jgi:hypothetical protein
VTWVKLGAPDPREDAAEERQNSEKGPQEPLWSLKPVSAPKPPVVKDQAWPRGAIDRFVLAKIESKRPSAHIRCGPAHAPAHGSRLTSPASRRPTRLTSSDLSDYVDSLLASRISASAGAATGSMWPATPNRTATTASAAIPSFPHAWRYRDYVIAAFNEDMPYDRFITEQIAGDLLPAESDAQRDRQLVATAFLALSAKPAKAMNDNFEMDVVADQIGVVGSGIMALSVGCARCHDHKTDPIPTRDYYALAGIFKSTETMWGAAAHQGLTAPQTALHELKPLRPKSSHARKSKRSFLAIRRTGRRRSRPSSMPPMRRWPWACATQKRSSTASSTSTANRRSSARRSRAAFSPSAVDATLKPDAKQSGRLQLAQWLASPQHPLTARVMVNRVWLQLFGEGLVRTPDDFGLSGEKPTHPELLDHLATRFMREGWSIKRLIRSIVLSRTYQLSSASDEALRRDDPDNTLLTRHNRRRLDAESVRDAMLAAAGNLNPQPAQGSLIQHRDVLINELPPLHQPSTHRSIYLLMLRNSMPPELTPFNLPEATAVTGKRDAATLATQSLYLLNNAFLVEQSRKFAERVQNAAADDAERIHFAYRQAFGRAASAAETQRAHDFIREAGAMLASAQNDDDMRLSDAWAAFCQALLVSNELRYID